MPGTATHNLKQMGLATHNLPATHRVIATLVARGVSPEGARQFLDGEAVLSSADRHRLSGHILPYMEQGNVHQLSPMSRWQFAAGAAVSDPDARAFLARLALTVLDQAAASAHPGGVNVSLADGSVR